MGLTRSSTTSRSPDGDRGWSDSVRCGEGRLHGRVDRPRRALSAAQRADERHLRRQRRRAGCARSCRRRASGPRGRGMKRLSRPGCSSVAPRLTRGSESGGGGGRGRVHQRQDHDLVTPSKPDSEPIGLEELRDISDVVRIPVIAISGINPSNARQCARPVRSESQWSGSRPDRRASASSLSSASSVCSRSSNAVALRRGSRTMWPSSTRAGSRPRTRRRRRALPPRLDLVAGSRFRAAAQHQRSPPRAPIRRA